MAHPITKRVNGIDLHNPERGWSLQEKGTSARVARTVRRAPLVIGGRHGSAPTGRLPVYEEASVSLTWLLMADTQAGLEDAYRDLVGVLSVPGLVYQHEAAGVVTEAPAELVSLTEPTDFTAGRLMRVSAILSLTDPFLRDVEYTTTGELSAGTHELTQLAGTAPIRDAVVRFTGPTTHVTVLDVVSGTQLEWIGSGVTSDRYLYLDPARMAAWHSASASAWDGSTGSVGASHGLDYTAAGPLQLWPHTGEVAGVIVRQVHLTTTGGSCVIRARRAWL